MPDSGAGAIAAAACPPSGGALARFSDEASAHRYLEELLWPTGPRCPRCASRGRIGKLNGGSTRIGTYKCYACRKSFSITYGTFFESSHVPVHKWLQAIYLTDCGAKPMRPYHLQKILNVSFKTAAAMMRKLSEAAATGRQDFAAAGAGMPDLSHAAMPVQFAAMPPVSAGYSPDPR